MNEQKITSDFYEFTFPNTYKKTNTDYQYVFTNYGCLEAINVDFKNVEKKFSFSSKKQKPLLSDDTSSHWFYFPTHPALPLGNPETICKLILLPTEQDLATLRLPKDDTDKRLIADVENHIANFALDHPDAAQGTFLELFSHYFPYPCSLRNAPFYITPSKKSRLDCGSSIPKSFLKVGQTSKFYPTYLDPYMCDIPLHILNKLILEELETEAKCLLYDSSYSGGVLNYEHIEQRLDLSYGILLHPGGKSMSELCIQLLCSSEHAESSSEESACFAPKIRMGSDYRVSLKGRILQIDSKRAFEEPEQISIGTRSLHNTLISSLDTRKTVLNIDENSFKSLSFSSQDCVQHWGVLQSPQVINSISLSPYIRGECVVALDDGKIYLWNASLSSNAKTEKVNSTSGALDVIINDGLNECQDRWNQVEFASHPRQIFVANRKEVSLHDLRGKNSTKQSLLDTCGKSDDMIMTILSGSNFYLPNEFQFVAATPSELNLYDIRYRKVALLTWGLNLRTPCQHLAVVSAPQDDATFNVNSVLLAASQRSQEIHMYQYNTSLKPAHPLFQDNAQQYSLHPPVEIAPLYACETFKEFRRTLTRRLYRSHGYLDNRLSHPIIGVAGFELKSSNCQSRIITLQVSSCGDLMFQPLDLRDPKRSWGAENVVSGPAPTTSQCAKEIERLTREKADVIRFKWAEGVCSRYREEVAKQPTINLRSSRTTLNTLRFSQKRIMDEISNFHSMPALSGCVFCKHNNFVKTFENDNSNNNESKSPFAASKTLHQNKHVCPSCGNDQFFFKHLLDTFKMKNSKHCDADDFFNIESSQLSSGPVTKDRKNIEKLKLVEPSASPTSLGGVLLATWDSSYEDFWKSIREKCEEKARLEKQRIQEGKFDLVAENVSDNSCDADKVLKPSTSVATSASINICQDTPRIDTLNSNNAADCIDVTATEINESTANFAASPHQISPIDSPLVQSPLLFSDDPQNKPGIKDLFSSFWSSDTNQTHKNIIASPIHSPNLNSPGPTAKPLSFKKSPGRTKRKFMGFY